MRTVVATEPTKMLQWDTKAIRYAALTIRAINHKLRMRLLDHINSAGSQGINVTNLYILMRLEQSVCSQHLAILKRAGLINAERKGKFITYTVNHDRIAAVNAAMAKLSEQ